MFCTPILWQNLAKTLSSTVFIFSLVDSISVSLSLMVASISLGEKRKKTCHENLS